MQINTEMYSETDSLLQLSTPLASLARPSQMATATLKNYDNRNPFLNTTPTREPPSPKNPGDFLITPPTKLMAGSFKSPALHSSANPLPKPGLSVRVKTPHPQSSQPIQVEPFRNSDWSYDPFDTSAHRIKRE